MSAASCTVSLFSISGAVREITRLSDVAVDRAQPAGGYLSTPLELEHLGANLEDVGLCNHGDWCLLQRVKVPNDLPEIR